MSLLPLYLALGHRALVATSVSTLLMGLSKVMEEGVWGQCIYVLQVLSCCATVLPRNTMLFVFFSFINIFRFTVEVRSNV